MSKKTMPSKKNNSTSVVKKTKFRKINRYNSFQKLLSSYLKNNKIKSTHKFSEVSKGIYSKIDKKVPVKGFEPYIEMLYVKNYQTSLQVEISKTLEEIPFFDVGRIFQNEYLILDYNVSASFDDSIDGDGVSIVLSGTPLDFLAEYDSSGLKNYLRNNYNDSPVAIFVLRHFDTETKTLHYDIEIDSSNVGGLHYVPFSGDVVVLNKPERTRRAELEKRVSGEPELKSVAPLTAKEMINLEKVKTKRIEKELNLIDQYRKLGYSNEEIRKKLDNL